MWIHFLCPRDQQFIVEIYACAFTCARSSTAGHLAQVWHFLVLPLAHFFSVFSQGRLCGLLLLSCAVDRYKCVALFVCGFSSFSV